MCCKKEQCVSVIEARGATEAAPAVLGKQGQDDFWTKFLSPPPLLMKHVEEKPLNVGSNQEKKEKENK